MNLEVNFTNQFKKDVKLASKQHRDLDVLFEIIKRLSNNSSSIIGNGLDKYLIVYYLIGYLDISSIIFLPASNLSTLLSEGPLNGLFLSL